MKKLITVVLGTRPEAIKLCPLILELKRRDFFRVSVLSTGQHRELLDGALGVFGVTPDRCLDVMREGRNCAVTTAAILAGCSETFTNERPDLVIVQGDTATAFAGALAAFHHGIPVAHVEAGLRTYHLRAPFPEEFHRESISLLADWHFAPTVTAKQNLIKEGRPEKRVFITGNTVVDALRLTLAKKPEKPLEIPKNTRLLLFTAHRREHFGETIAGMFRALRRIVETHPDVIAVCPVHPNPDVRETAEKIVGKTERILLCEPPDVSRFHHLLASAYLVLTDSGGIQEEATALGIPTVVMRYSTERTEGILSGNLRLAGSGEEGIVELTDRLLEADSELYRSMQKPSAVFGNGNASARIAAILENCL